MPWLTAPQLTFGDDSGRGRGGLSAISDIATARFFSPDLDTNPEAAVIRWNSTAQQSGGCSFLLDPCPGIRSASLFAHDEGSSCTLKELTFWCFVAFVYLSLSLHRCVLVMVSDRLLTRNTHARSRRCLWRWWWIFSKLTFVRRNVMVVFPSVHICTRISPRPFFTI